MPEEMSLEKEQLYEWVADNLDKITKAIQTILRNNPNQFVSIREIAERLNWPFGGYKELDWICTYATYFGWFNRNSEPLEYKYDPDREKNSNHFWYRDSNKEYTKIRIELRDLLLYWFRLLRRIRRREEQDEILQRLNEQLSRTRRDELEQRRGGY